MLMAMRATRMRGYDPVRLYRPTTHGEADLPVYRMTGKAAWITSIAGSVVLCVSWWLNVNVELVVSAWKGILH